MAKVQGVLFSIEANGQFAKTVVFDRRGHVRAYTNLANAPTGLQGDVRQRMQAVQNGISVRRATTRDVVKAATPVDYRWNSFLVGKAIGSGTATQRRCAAFAAPAPAGQADWVMGQGNGVNGSSLKPTAKAQPIYRSSLKRYGFFFLLWDRTILHRRQIAGNLSRL